MIETDIRKPPQQVIPLFISEAACTDRSFRAYCDPIYFSQILAIDGVSGRAEKDYVFVIVSPLFVYEDIRDYVVYLVG